MTATGDRSLQIRRLKARIEAEMEEVASVAKEAQEHLARFRDATPDSLAVRGLGDILHDFYTGLEKVFESIAESFDGGVPTGIHWHRKLLEEMGLALEGSRPAVLKRETVHNLIEYLRFRHLFRHIYGHELKWDRILALLQGMDALTAVVFEDLGHFCTFLGELADKLEGSSRDSG